MRKSQGMKKEGSKKNKNDNKDKKRKMPLSMEEIANNLKMRYGIDVH